MSVDHVQAALDALNHAHNVDNAVLATVALANAQVHATLAVAEQARIANLIAVYDDEHAPLKQILEGLALK